MLYLYMKSFYLIFLIAWMVSLLYLPRLFVYLNVLKLVHRTIYFTNGNKINKNYSYTRNVFNFYIWYCSLTSPKDLIYENYFIIKLILVLFLVIFQVYLIFEYLFLKKENTKSGKFYKLINEIPTLFMIIILFVVLKPNLVKKKSSQ